MQDDPIAIMRTAVSEFAQGPADVDGGEFINAALAAAGYAVMKVEPIRKPLQQMVDEPMAKPPFGEIHDALDVIRAATKETTDAG